MQFRNARKHSAFMRIAIEQLQAFEAGSIQIIMNIGGEILADVVFAQIKF